MAFLTNLRQHVSTKLAGLMAQYWDPDEKIFVIQVKGKTMLVNSDEEEISQRVKETVDESDIGSAGATTYVRTEITMDLFKYLSFYYLLVSDDADNTITLKVYITEDQDAELPNDTTAITAGSGFPPASEEVLGNAAGLSVVNGTIEDQVFIDHPLQNNRVVIELAFATTVAPAVVGNTASIEIRKSN